MTFAEKVLEVVKNIPKGSTLSYKEVATLAGSPGASRVVGTLMRKNKNREVPCHRVICSGGRLGQYSLGGPEAKRKILQEEGAI
jgi:methylated-DNA-[protein]-cysteine S-methyltransferase